MVITDYSLNTYTHVDEMIRAGGDLFLTQDTKTFNKDDDATQITLLRKATKNILYTVVNSNAMSVNIEGYLKPLWQEWMVYIDIALGALLVLWGVGIILATKKNPKPIQKKSESIATVRSSCKRCLKQQYQIAVGADIIRPYLREITNGDSSTRR